MDSRISSQISKLSAYTDSQYKNIQRIYIPSVYNLHVERMYRTDYSMANKGFLKNSLSFVSNNLPILYHKYGDEFSGNILDLVNRGYIQPFIIFYKGKMVKWTDVGVKVTHRYNYLFLKNIDAVNFESNKDVQCILLPTVGIYYREHISLDLLKSGNIITKEETPIFLFNSNGELVSGEPNDSSVSYTMITSVKNRNDFKIEQFKVKANTPYVSNIISENNYINKQNIIYFTDFLLPNNAYDKELFHKRNHNIFSLDGDNDKEYDVKVFFYNNGNDSKNIISNIINPDAPGLDIYRHDKDFDFNFDIHKSYKENVTNALKYCMSYNSAFMNSLYKNLSNIKSVTYSGKHIKSLIDKNYHIRMSTRKDAENYNKVIIFHNGNLYRKYHTIEWISKDFRFYCDPDDINDNDVFEFLYFKKSYNLEKTIVMDSDGDDMYFIGVDVDMDNVSLYSTNLYEGHRFFNIEISDFAQYKIPFKYKKIDQYMYKIYPEHPYYYDKKCTLVSNRQFRYCFTKIREDNTVNFELTEEFKFCVDPNKYMVYINGKRINNSNYKITIVKNTRPFYSHSIYFNIPLFEGDEVDVFYVPDALSEIYIDKDLNPTSGAIIVDKSKLSYNLDSDLYLFYINGRKVNPKDIINIGKNVVKIKNANSINNVSIIKHINSIDVLSRLFTYTDDIMDNIINEFDTDNIHESLNKLYGESNLNDEEIPFNSNSIEMKDILYKIIKDYWNKPYVTDGTEFIYDFDTDGLDIDSNGDIIIPTMDASVEY